MSSARTSTPFLRIPRAILDQMIAHAQREAPQECCGILGGAGIGVEVCSIYPLRNADPNPIKRFESDSRDLLAAHKAIRESRQVWAGIYHSHPKDPAVPSRTDLERNAYDATPCVIVSLAEAEPCVRVWRLGRDAYWELPWETVESGGESPA